jgi:hypothetical protein
MKSGLFGPVQLLTPSTKPASTPPDEQDQAEE